MTSADEYSDMEFVEFLEFLVRISFQQYLGEDRTISDKLADLLKEMLNLTNIPYQEPPKHGPLQTQASDDDIQAFHRYVSREM